MPGFHCSTAVEHAPNLWYPAVLLDSDGLGWSAGDASLGSDMCTVFVITWLSSSSVVVLWNLNVTAPGLTELRLQIASAPEHWFIAEDNLSPAAGNLGAALSLSLHWRCALFLSHRVLSGTVKKVEWVISASCSFSKAFNVLFDLQCAFSWIRVMTQLSVWREVFTMIFNCDERSKAVCIWGQYWRSVEQFHMCQGTSCVWLRFSCLAHPSPAAWAVSVGGVCMPGDTGVVM